jgi:hypothetical protein
MINIVEETNLLDSLSNGIEAPWCLVHQCNSLISGKIGEMVNLDDGS